MTTKNYLDEQLLLGINNQIIEQPFIEIPTDYPRLPIHPYKYAREEFHISKKLTSELQKLGIENDANLYMTLLAAFKTLLFRYSGQTDINVSTFLGEEFNNSVINIKDRIAFKDLLQEVRGVILNKSQFLKDQNTSHNTALSNVKFTLSNILLEYIEAQMDIEIKYLRNTSQKNFELILVIQEGIDGTKGLIEYNSNLFKSSTIKRMIGNFITLLNSITKECNKAIDDLPILTEIERNQLMNNFNNTERIFENDDQLLHFFFEEQVLKTPNAIAITAHGKSLSYIELNRRANQLANYLREQGAGPNKLVGIMIERSLEMAIGILGILKSGAAYLPIDPSYPSDRITYILKDGNVEILITNSKQKSINEISTVRLDAEWTSITTYSEDNLNLSVGQNSLAYVIYTSGSTGKPKGVAVGHNSIVNTLLWRKEEYKLIEEDVVLQLSSFSFDSFITNFFTPLFSGAKVIFLTEEEAKDSLAIQKAIVKYRVSHFTCVPILYSALLEKLNYEESKSLKVITLAGESVSEQIVQKSKKLNPEIELVNEYGPTECSVASTVLRDLNSKKRVTIGKPIHNAEIYILNNDQLQPIGVPGELCISGKGVTKGYLNRPELTNEKFVPNPIKKGLIMYRTGDLAKWLPDGNIDYLGRIDHQVKIRGYRIELGEIETLLTKHPNIQEAVVTAQEDRQKNSYLIGYLVLKDQSLNHEASYYRKYLLKILPDYMVPRLFIPIESLPLTSNGKVNRKALPIPVKQELNTVYVKPRSHIEVEVIRIWESIFNNRYIGIHDNFFDLGGDSLSAMQIISRINNEFSQEIAVKVLFEFPTVESLASYIQRLLENKNLVENDISIQKLTCENKNLASFSQKRLWLLDQMLPNKAVYNVPTALRIKGNLDIRILELSLIEIIQRHDVLRSYFTIENDELIQNTLDTDEIKSVLEYKDLSNLDAENFQSEMINIIKNDMVEPFNLTIGPLFHFKLLQNNDEYILYVNMHHIITDGWSNNIFLEELFNLYNAFSKGLPTPLEKLPIQYGDYSNWQNSWFRGVTREKQLDYWKKQLQGELPVLELPTDFVRPPSQSYEGSCQEFHIPIELVNELQKLSRENNATLFMTLLASFKTLLYRYSGQEDLCVGTPVAGRMAKDTEKLIGFFVNNLVIRTKMSDKPTFRELLNQVREITLDAYSHQDFPFEQLVEEIVEHRDASYSPLFQVMFVLHNTPEVNVEKITNLEINHISIPTQSAKFDLTLEMKELKDGMQGIVEYNSNLFKSSSIKRMIGNFITLLNSITKECNKAIDDLPILTEIERNQLINNFNNTERIFENDDKLLHFFFEEQVLKTPNAIALTAHGESLSYIELNRRSNQLANYLREQGVGPNKLVGIMIERSIEMAIGILGILKSGAAYLPIDPSYPSDRTIYILKDGNVEILITNSELSKYKSFNEISTVCLDAEWTSITTYSEDNLNLSVGPNNLAYVIYTSGSTGKPKGVAVGHNSIVNTLLWRKEEYKLIEEDVVLQLSSFSFDSFITNFFTPLISGARVIFLTEEEAKNPLAIQKAIVKYRVSHFTCVPILYSALLEKLKYEESKSLKVITLAGESVSEQIVQKSKTLNPEIELVNEYGPTECSVASTILRDLNAKKRVTIGKPIHNAEVYILNYDQLQPIGVPGELCISGKGVTKGYLNRPELTNEKFVPNPIKKGLIMYRTGDLAKWLPDGNIDYLGRIDHQVKIRGYRIELEEIEAVLIKHPKIKHAVVIENEDDLQNKRLIAFLVGIDNEKVDLFELKRFISNILPSYMVPAIFEYLDEIPKNSNGKVDRNSLSRYLVENTMFDNENYKGPREYVEVGLQKIWEGIFKISPISITTDFFDLGGHSLLLLQLYELIRQRFNVEVPMNILLNQSTIEEIGYYIRKSLGNSDLDSKSSLVTLKPTGKKNPIYLLHTPGGYLFLYEGFVRQMDKDQPVYGFQMTEENKNKSLKQIAASYVEELIKFQPEGDYILAGYSSGGIIAVEMATQLRDKGYTVAFVGLFDTFVAKPVNEISEFDLFLDYALRYHPSKEVIEKLRNLDFEERLKIVYKMELDRKTVPPDFTIDRHRILVTSYITFLRALLTHQQGVYDGKVTLFKALDMEEDSRVGWDKVLKQDLNVKFVPGNHALLMLSPNVEVLSEEFKNSIKALYQEWN